MIHRMLLGSWKKDVFKILVTTRGQFDLTVSIFQTSPSMKLHHCQGRKMQADKNKSQIFFFKSNAFLALAISL